jgi:S-formylglutathione hydrolase FrmB
MTPDVILSKAGTDMRTLRRESVTAPRFYQQLPACLLATLLVCVLASAAVAQEGRVVRDKIHAPSLEKNVTKEATDRDVSIYLPPGYDSSPNKRYPVIYLLHGIGDNDQTWTTPWVKGAAWQSLPDVMNRGIAEHRFGEMMVVMPDARTNWGGSFYTNSAATGNWEDFIVSDLVRYIDSKYRTLARSESRGLAGHSMGGYGAIKLGMKHPEVYSVVYGINPAVLGWAEDLSAENPAFDWVLTKQPKTIEEAMQGGFYPVGIIVVAQAFSPNGNQPGTFADLPFKRVDGKIEKAEPAYTQWSENMPLYMVDRYVANLKKLRGFKFDSGYEDEFKHIPPTTRAFSAALTKNGVNHVFEEYNGDHRNRMMGREGRLANEVLPYFWMLLDK